MGAQSVLYCDRVMPAYIARPVRCQIPARELGPTWKQHRVDAHRHLSSADFLRECCAVHPRAPGTGEGRAASIPTPWAWTESNSQIPMCMHSHILPGRQHGDWIPPKVTQGRSQLSSHCSFLLLTALRIRTRPADHWEPSVGPTRGPEGPILVCLLGSAVTGRSPRSCVKSCLFLPCGLPPVPLSRALTEVKPGSSPATKGDTQSAVPGQTG